MKPITKALKSIPWQQSVDFRTGRVAKNDFRATPLTSGERLKLDPERFEPNIVVKPVSVSALQKIKLLHLLKL